MCSKSARTQRKVDNPEGLPDVTVSGWLRLVALAIALRSPLRFEAPGRSGDVPEREDPTETRRRWDEVRSQWRELVERFPPELKRKGVFRHPFAGRVTLCQALGFTAKHFRHHDQTAGATSTAMGVMASTTSLPIAASRLTPGMT